VSRGKTEKYWDHELESLGLELKRKNELNDENELAALADTIKQVAFQDYKTAYQDSDDRQLEYIIWGCCVGIE